MPKQSPPKGPPKPSPGARRYWLFKSEPDVYGFDQLVADRRTSWGGVRNYQARNLLRDEIRVGDGVLFYHSSTEPMAVAGVARVVRAGHPDATALDPSSPYCDPDSSPDDPRWFAVDIAPVAPARPPLTREAMKEEPALRGMMLLRPGARLSVQPVAPAEWRTVLRLCGVEETW
jgi:predicted RNA-binding protein with PUA-like domain